MSENIESIDNDLDDSKTVEDQNEEINANESNESNNEKLENVEEEEDFDDTDEQTIIEKKRQKILLKKIDLDKYLQKDEKEKEGGPKNINDIDLKSVDYNSFDSINTEHIDLYYMLNDNKNNIEFLDEDLVLQSKKEDEIRALKKQEKDEFDFNLEELVDEDRIKVDLTGIVDDLEKDK